MSAGRLEFEIPMPPTGAEYIESHRGQSKYSRVGKAYRRAVRDAVRGRGRLMFKPVSACLVFHERRGRPVSLPEAHAVAMSALASSTAFLTQRQLEHVEYMRGEEHPEGTVVVILEGAQ